MSQVTRLLEAAHAGDRQAAADLLPIVYDELRKLAAAKMATERADHTLDATALVHEAFLRLGVDRSFASRSHFFRAAAEAMRRILVDHARRRNADKRGTGRRELLDYDVAAPELDSNLEALDEALTRLAVVQPKVAELVQLRYFAGLSIPEAAALIGVSPRTADGWWAYARGWLAAELRKS